MVLTFLTQSIVCDYFNQSHWREEESKVGSKWDEEVRVNNGADSVSHLLDRSSEASRRYTDLQRASEGRGRRERSLAATPLEHSHLTRQTQPLARLVESSQRK